MKRKHNFQYNKLRGLIKEKYGTMAAFSADLGVSTTSLSNKLNNVVPFTQDEIFKAIKLLDIEAGEITDIFFTKKIQKTEYQNKRA